MNGVIYIKISNKRLSYELTLRSQITVLTGDSASGKSELLSFINDYSRGKVVASCNCPYEMEVVDGNGWDVLIDSYKDKIIFIEQEENNWVLTHEFAEKVKKSNSYFVIVSRRPLNNLPYGISDILFMRSSGKFHVATQMYTSDLFYNTLSINNIVAEGEKSDYHAFCGMFGKSLVISASGKDKILKVVESNAPSFAFTDGCGFGACIEEIVNAINAGAIECILWCPESFEYLMLKLGIFGKGNPPIDVEKERMESSLEAGTFFGYEKYYTYLLQEATKYTIRYVKGKEYEQYSKEFFKKLMYSIFPDVVSKALSELSK